MVRKAVVFIFEERIVRVFLVIITFANCCFFLLNVDPVKKVYIKEFTSRILTIIKFYFALP